MWLNLLIATIIIVGFLSISLWLKIYFEKGSSDPENECEQEKKKTENLSACAHCGLKDQTNCSVAIQIK